MAGWRSTPGPHAPAAHLRRRRCLQHGHRHRGRRRQCRQAGRAGNPRNSWAARRRRGLAGNSLPVPASSPPSPVAAPKPVRRTCQPGDVGTWATGHQPAVLPQEAARGIPASAAGRFDLELRRSQFRPRFRRSLREAGERCFHCGVCTHCDICVNVCPSAAITQVDGTYRIDTAKCTACRVCEAECPRSAISMPQTGVCIACGYCTTWFECPSLKRGPDGLVDIDRRTCIDCGMCIQVCAQGAIRPRQTPQVEIRT